MNLCVCLSQKARASILRLYLDSYLMTQCHFRQRVDIGGKPVYSWTKRCTASVSASVGDERFAAHGHGTPPWLPLGVRLKPPQPGYPTKKTHAQPPGLKIFGHWSIVAPLQFSTLLSFLFGGIEQLKARDQSYCR